MWHSENSVFSSDGQIVDVPVSPQVQVRFISDGALEAAVEEAQSTYRPAKPGPGRQGSLHVLWAWLADELAAVRWEVTVPIAVTLTGILLAFHLIVP